MIIKRYICDNMNEALVKIRYELGSDAVIVSQRKIRQNGLIGLLRPKKIEVTAAADDKSNKVTESVQARNDMHREINELKTMVKSLVEQKEPAAPQMPKKEGKTKYKQKLMDNDIPEEIVNDILERIKATNGDKRVNSRNYDKEIKNIIEEMIKTDNDMGGRIQILVGPTGVGKTTTIAKLASLHTLYNNKKVGLITIDTYRIGAVEQLKTYAEILGVPFGVILSSKDIPDVMNKMEDCDIILVDTTGRNSKNVIQVSETRKFIEELKADKVHLVLSMTTKNNDIKRIIQNYRMLNYNSLILTKIDETDACGAVISALYYSNVPVSFITNGQNVPSDLEEAKSERLLKLVLGAEE